MRKMHVRMTSMEDTDRHRAQLHGLTWFMICGVMRQKERVHVRARITRINTNRWHRYSVFSPALCYGRISYGRRGRAEIRDMIIACY